MSLFGRSRRPEKPHRLEWRIALFSVGAALAFGGMLLRVDWLVTVAIVVLVAGFVLRFAPSGAREEGPSESSRRDLS